jgi:hypothetical protein
MLANVDLHLRVNPGDAHRNLGLVLVECVGPQVLPHQDIECLAGGRQVRAHITSVRRDGAHLPHVYADTVEE